MAVEIRELVIKSTIDPKKEINDEPNVELSLDAEKLKKQIIEECVDVVMEKIERKARR